MFSMCWMAEHLSRGHVDPHIRTSASCTLSMSQGSLAEVGDSSHMT